jgi:hypothetical protein
MLKFIKKKVALQWMLLLGLLTLAVYKIITQTELANNYESPFLFQSFTLLFDSSIFLSKGIIIAILLLQIILLQFYFLKNELSVKFSLIPACFFLSIMLITKSLFIIYPSFFTILFLLIIISIEQNASLSSTNYNVFWIGVIIALATGFDYSSIFLLIIIMIILLMHQFSRVKVIGILFFGFFLTYLCFFSYFFLTDQLAEWVSTFDQINILKIINKKPLANIYTFFSSIVLSLIFAYFIIKTTRNGILKGIVLRKRFFLLIIITFIVLWH